MAIPNTYTSSGSDPNVHTVYAQEWETKLQARLDYPITYKEVCKVIYSDTYAINSPYMSTSFSAQTGTRGCSYGFSEFTLTNDQLVISSFKIVPIFIDRADLAQCKLANQMEFASRQASLLNEELEAAVLAGYDGWTDFGLADIGGGGASTDAITVDVNNIDDIIRGMKREVAENNAQNLADSNGLFIVWRAADLELLEQFAQANGFNLADAALKNGIKSGYHFMGIDHYISNKHTAGHVFGGVKKIMNLGVLSATYGKIVINQDPASGVTTYGPVSGIGVVSRVDYGINTPTGLKTAVFDINVS
jgi:hypothetical protein